MSQFVVGSPPLGVRLNEESGTMISTTSAVKGDVRMIDVSVTSSDNEGRWTTMLATSAAECEYGWFGVCIDDSIAAGAAGKWVFVSSDVIAKLNTNAAKGNPLIVRTTNGDLTSAATVGMKIVARSKNALTGLQPVTFDGWNGFGKHKA